MTIYENITAPSILCKPKKSIIKSIGKIKDVFSDKTITLQTALPIIIEEKINVKSLQESKLYFWDVENYPDFNPKELDGHVFVVANLNIAMIEKFQTMKQQYKQISFHVYDTSHSQKNYADIIIGTLIGEIFQGCKHLKEVNLISKDKGFESIQYFLKTQGLQNVNIINNQSNHIVQPSEKLSKPLKITKHIIDNNEYLDFFAEVDKRFVPQKYINLKTLKKLGIQYNIAESKLLSILNDAYNYTISENNKLITIRKK